MKDPNAKNGMENGTTRSKTYSPRTGPSNQYTPKGPAVTPDTHRISGGRTEDQTHESLRRKK